MNKFDFTCNFVADFYDSSLDAADELAESINFFAGISGVYGDDGDFVEITNPARRALVLGGNDFECAVGGNGLAVECRPR